MASSPLTALAHPFPGLRAFEPHEAFLFRGREQHVEELLTRLSEHRFMAVLGNSGSGKSSLVRAGLLPALYRGYLTGATTQWRTAILRPGAAPMTALAEALRDPLALGARFAADGAETLGSSSMGLVRLVEAANLSRGESLLVVVDQFEELFRFRNESHARDGGAEAALFVRSLLAAVEAYGAPIYVALTMRSEYTGDCAQFTGLTEALNRGQYLVPRLTREQRRQAIEEPAAMAGIAIEPRLVQRFLNDAGDDPDQLPVLAHALMRTFHIWKTAGASGPMDLAHYEHAGGIGSALDQHATSLLSELGPAGEVWGPKVFRCLTLSEQGRDVRRPARLQRIFEVTGAATEEDRTVIQELVAAFARPENSLLVCSGNGFLRADDIVDITHECLIRKWSVLREWLRAETRNAEWYCDLASDVVRYAAGEKALWRSPDLMQVLKLHQENGWNAAWAAQYWPAEAPPTFSEVESFLQASRLAEEEQRREEELRRRRDVEEARQLAEARKRASRWLLGASILLAILLVGGVVSFFIHQRDESRIQNEREMRLKAEQDLTKLYAERENQKNYVDELNNRLVSARGQEAVQVKQRLELAQAELRKTDSEIAMKKATTTPAPPGDEALAQIQNLQTQIAALRVERDQLKARQGASVSKGSLPVVPAPAAEPATGSTAPSSGSPTGIAASGADTKKGASPLSADQVRTIKQILAVFETGRADLAGWERMITFDALSRYAQTDTAAANGQLETFKKSRGLSDLNSMRSNDFDEALTLLAADPGWKQYRMQNGPDGIFERALAQANSLGIHTALGTAVIFDSLVQGGFNTIRDRTTAEAGGTPAAGAEERAWITLFVGKRREFLQSRRLSPNRADAFAALIRSNSWDLTRPVAVLGMIIE